MKVTPLILSGILCVGVGLPIAGAAQGAPAPAASSAPGAWGGGGHHHGSAFMHALRGVNLSDQQKQQIKQIMSQYRQAHPEGSAPDPQAMQQVHQQIMNVLTPDQQAQVKQNMQQMRQSQMQGQSGASGQEPAATPTP